MKTTTTRGLINSEKILFAKVEKLEKQLEIAIKVLEHYENKKLCIKALEEINKTEKESK